MRNTRVKTSLKPLAVIAIGTLGWPADAAAYLDPGTGSMILQGLIAGLAGLAVACRLYWHKLKNLFKCPTPPADEVEEAPAPQGDQTQHSGRG